MFIYAENKACSIVSTVLEFVIVVVVAIVAPIKDSWLISANLKYQYTKIQTRVQIFLNFNALFLFLSSGSYLLTHETNMHYIGPSLGTMSKIMNEIQSLCPHEMFCL